MMIPREERFNLKDPKFPHVTIASLYVYKGWITRIERELSRDYHVVCPNDETFEADVCEFLNLLYGQNQKEYDRLVTLLSEDFVEKLCVLQC